jgi:hypothetical protein
MEIGKTPSGADGVLPHPPEAFNGVEVVPTMGGQKRAPHHVVVVSAWRVELVRPMDATAIGDHDDLCAGVADGGQHLMEILVQLLRIKVRHDFIE